MAGCRAASLPGGAAAAAWKMAAPCGSELPANSPLKIPKMEVLSPASPGDLSDGNPSLSDPSTPRGASPLGPGSAAGSGAAASGGLGLGLGGRSAASSSVSFSPGGGSGGAAAAAAAACRGMSWTPAETNALIAVWGNERLVEARYQQLEGAGTVFGSKAPGPAMYERVSRALAELGYERTPSQCRERIKVTGRSAPGQRTRGREGGEAGLGAGAGPSAGLPSRAPGTPCVCSASFFSPWEGTLLSRWPPARRFPEFEVGRVCRRPSFLPIEDVPAALKLVVSRSVRGAALSRVLSPALLCSQIEGLPG